MASGYNLVTDSFDLGSKVTYFADMTVRLGELVVVLVLVLFEYL